MLIVVHYLHQFTLNESVYWSFGIILMDFVFIIILLVFDLDTIENVIYQKNSKVVFNLLIND